VKANGYANGDVKKDDDATMPQKGHLNGTVNRFHNTFNKFTTEMCNPALNSNTTTRQRILVNGNANGNGGNK